MNILCNSMLLSGAAMLALTACSPKTEENAGKVDATSTAGIDQKDPVASAMAAAPAAVAGKAAIVVTEADGSMKTLREGTNGFTCMPDNPVTPGPDPMCMDANALAWATAWMGGGQPAKETPGFIYMLAGGTDASNTDPFAKEPTSGGDWIKTGPHVMIVGSANALKGYPSGPNPDTSQPYIMWAGTRYAHLMIPVG